MESENFPINRGFRNQALNELKTRLPGKVILPDHPDYHQARSIWNGFIDRYPAVIIRCQDAGDVAMAIRFARDQGLEIAVRGGGHSSPGYGVIDGGLVIDLSPMNEIVVDPQRKTARVSAGAKLGALIRATEKYGLVTPVGTASDTGVAGLTLGGGFGYLTGKYGLACDNVLTFTMVTAEGNVVKASAAENPGLYWGLRGGGGNFGVVTTFEFQLHPLQGVLGGVLTYPMEKAGKVLRYYRDYCEASPDELTIFASLTTTADGQPVVTITPCYCGDLQAGEQILAPLRKYGPPAMDQIRPMGFLEMISQNDGSSPNGMNYFDKGWMLPDLSDAAIEVTIAAGASRTSPLSAVVIQPMNGVGRRVPVDATAFAARKSIGGALVAAAWSEGPAEPHLAWVRKYHTAYKPHAMSENYVNFITVEEQPLVPSAYGSNYARLVALKRRYDPENIFHHNVNILPE